jgi:hypothetical protein
MIVAIICPESLVALAIVSLALALKTNKLFKDQAAADNVEWSLTLLFGTHGWLCVSHS